MQYLILLVESLETTNVSYLYDCTPLPGALNGNSIAQAVNNAVTFIRNKKNSFCFLLSDAAKYMLAAGTILKSL